MSIEDGQPEQFTASWTQTWHNFLKPFLPTNIVVFIVLFMIGYVVAGPVVSVVLPVVVVGGIVGLGRLSSTRNGVRVSGYGIEVRSRGNLVGLRWADISEVVVLNKRTSTVVAPYGLALGVARASAQGFANANSGPGLVGQGSVLRVSLAGAALANPQWLATQPTQVPVKMFLAVVDRDWPTGRIGAWLRAYRPDLYAAGRPDAGPTPGRV